MQLIGVRYLPGVGKFTASSEYCSQNSTRVLVLCHPGATLPHSNVYVQSLMLSSKPIAFTAKQYVPPARRRSRAHALDQYSAYDFTSSALCFGLSTTSPSAGTFAAGTFSPFPSALPFAFKLVESLGNSFT